MEPQSTNILTSLGINGWQFAAQFVNFSIVVFVMWKWVYVPLLKIMESRSKQISDGLTNAKQAKERLSDAEIEKERILNDARAEAHILLEDIRSKAESIRKEKLGQAKTEIEKHIADAKMQIKNERDASASALQRDVADLVVLATEKVAGHMDPAHIRSLATHAIDEISSA